MPLKVKVELWIDRALLDKAGLYGIDLQTFVEVKLYEYITGREQFYNSKLLYYEEIKEDFEKWLRRKISPETAKRYLSVLQSLNEITPESLIKLYEANPTNNRAKAIRNLVNYLLEKEKIDEKVASKIKKAIPIKKCKKDKNTPSTEDIREAFDYFKNNLGYEYYLIALVILYSGARLRHVLRMVKEWDKKYLEFKEGFARYEISHFTQRTKEGFFIYMPDWLAKALWRMNDVTEDKLKKKIHYRAKSGRLISAKYLRKWFNNFLAKMRVDKDVRNFILGRPGEISRSVESDYYLELKELADEEYPRILKNFPFDFRI